VSEIATPTTESAPAGRPAPRRREPGRGLLRVYLGATPGSGKTFAMLREGADRRRQGEDVVVGFVETHGRALTQAAIGTLEVIPRLAIEYRGRRYEDMDVDAVLARRPRVALVDELAHTNVPGMRHAKRWEDVEELRDNGIDVITTVNVQHIESVKDLVEHITGIPVRETLPDSVIEGADEIQFIDISPEALRKRMRHGNVYAPEKVDTALANFFRPGNLAALREIALRLVAQNVGAARTARQAPQDVLVAVSGRDSSEPLIRRGARLARRFSGLCTVVMARDPRRPVDEAVVDRLRVVAAQLHCHFVELVGDVRDVITRTAGELGVRHVVLGEEAPRSLLQRLRGGVVDAVVNRLPDVDVHVIGRVAHPTSAPSGQEPQRPDADALLRALSASTSRRGHLRVYLGYARGCGTTTAMLEEARRRKRRGTDVVVATVRTSGRGACEEVLSDLEILGGPSGPATRGLLDTEALLRRNPDVCCLDDLGGDTVAGRRILDDVPEILEAGISIVATLHLVDLRSVREAMGSMLASSAMPGQPVDDMVLGLVDELELVDVTPSVLDERLRRGEILPPSDAARALQGEFRPPVLEALRETAFRIIASHTDRRLVDYMRERHIERPWEAKPRVMLCVPARDGMEPIIRRAAKLARSMDGDFTAVTVRNRPRSEAEKMRIGSYAALTHQLGGEFVTLYERRVAPALAAHARRILATQVVVTRGRHRGWRRNTLRELIHILSDVDIHILSAVEL
jgi:two-component system sensor histidine kinase KdpD